MTIDDLTQQIAETERLITVYRNANEVIVGTQDQIYSRRGLINRTTLTGRNRRPNRQYPRTPTCGDAGRAPKTQHRIPRGKAVIAHAGRTERAAVVATLAVRPVCPQLRKCVRTVTIAGLILV